MTFSNMASIFVISAACVLHLYVVPYMAYASCWFLLGIFRYLPFSGEPFFFKYRRRAALVLSFPFLWGVLLAYYGKEVYNELIWFLPAVLIVPYEEFYLYFSTPLLLAFFFFRRIFRGYALEGKRFSGQPPTVRRGFTASMALLLVVFLSFFYIHGMRVADYAIRNGHYAAAKTLLHFGVVPCLENAAAFLFQAEGQERVTVLHLLIMGSERWWTLPRYYYSGDAMMPASRKDLMSMLVHHYIFDDEAADDEAAVAQDPGARLAVEHLERECHTDADVRLLCLNILAGGYTVGNTPVGFPMAQLLLQTNVAQDRDLLHMALDRAHLPGRLQYVQALQAALYETPDASGQSDPGK